MAVARIELSTTTLIFYSQIFRGKLSSGCELSTESQQLSFLQRAEHFIILLDGEKFTVPAER